MSNAPGCFYFNFPSYIELLSNVWKNENCTIDLFEPCMSITNIKMNDILKILFHLACHAIMKNKVFFQRLQTFANHLIKMEQTLLLFHILWCFFI